MNALEKRDEAVRIMLLDNARETAPRRRARTALIASIAFVLGGGLAVGAMSAAVAATGGPNLPQSPSNSLAVMTPGGKAVGPLVSYKGSNDAQLNLGARPDGVTGIAFELVCGGTGTYTSTAGGQSLGPGDCTEGSGFGSTTTQNPTDSTVTINTDGKFSYVVWAQWVDVPPTPTVVQPSAAQNAATADGKITSPELQAAANRFATCMSTAGFPIAIVHYEPSVAWTSDQDGANYADSYAATTRCSQLELDKIDAIWLAQGSKQ